MTLEELIGAVLDVPAATLDNAVRQSDVPNWSSLAHINLVTALEETYGVSFTTDEIQTLTSVGAARQLLRGKGAAV